MFATIFRRRTNFTPRENLPTPRTLTKKFCNPARIRPILLFNYGNAEFKSGNLGKAIAAFRRAELLAPRDSEIRANLRFRSQSSSRRDRSRKSLAKLARPALAERMGDLHGNFILADVHFARCQTTSSRARAKIKNAGLGFLPVLTIFSGAILGVQAANHFSNQTAVVISAQARRAAGRLTTRKMRSRCTTARNFPFWIATKTGFKSRTARAKAAGCHETD